MSEMAGYILAGGASSRMGRDKGALRLCGQTFVERVAAALRSVTSELYVVSSKPDAGQWGLPVVTDLRGNCGALGGLHAALSAAQTRRAAVVSCDLPFVTGQLFERLASLCAEDFDAVAPVQPDGRPQPLCAIYETESCRRVADEMIRSGELRPRELLARVRTRWVLPEALSDLEGAALFFLNVNTPGEYEIAQREVKR